MKVLVTGGTGFVGGEILRELHDAGHSIRLLVRNPNSTHSKKIKTDFGVEFCAGNILEKDSLAEFCSSGDAIINLVGIISEIGRNTFEAIHHRGTTNVVAAAQKGNIRRFIQMSALGSRPDAVSSYHRSKWAGEEAVRQSGLEFTIFRPSIIYGCGDAFTNLFSRMSRFSPVLPVMGSGQGTMQPVSVAVVAKCFVRALSEPESIGKNFDLVGSDVLTVNDVFDAILNATGRHRLKLHVPLAVARVTASILEFIYPRILRKAPPLNRDQLIMLQEKNIGDGTSAEQVFKIQCPDFVDNLEYLCRKNG